MKFYEKDWFIILMLFIFFPVGLFLMWKYSKWNREAKIIISILFVVVGIFSGVNKTNENVDINDSNVNIETVKKDEYKEIKDNSKIILDTKNYYDMNADERKTINDLISKWDKLDEEFKNIYNDKKTQYESDKYYDTNYEGIIVSTVQEEVEKQLKSPKSADFPWNFDEYNITYQGETDDGLYMYTVTSYVDATNSFGAEIRTKYICAISVTKDLKNYKAIVVFDE